MKPFEIQELTPAFVAELTITIHGFEMKADSELEQVLFSPVEMPTCILPDSIRPEGIAYNDSPDGMPQEKMELYAALLRARVDGLIMINVPQQDSLHDTSMCFVRQLVSFKTFLAELCAEYYPCIGEESTLRMTSPGTATSSMIRDELIEIGFIPNSASTKEILFPAEEKKGFLKRLFGWL